ncbi:MAG: N-acetyl-gamma-glutamyl-phosphate reductase [Deltaproteobacteria bacterium]|uniref:N-acetyl-gamma-glutamyl-phosphate reductase n=1 Tax=Candidatus Zymogenus saltonus TaxID=2844893 RepID=A0A9D8KGL6_9DELT|nr:N-acetyl-gamma-glutamyl-phosphate reductase [Candidatus Zymogenus saltonus]
MIKTAIIGASGYTGCELLRLLSHHPDMEVAVVTSRQYSGKTVSEVFPHLASFFDNLTFEEPNYREIGERVDAAFTALPHGSAVEAVYELSSSEGKTVPVVDLSADFRFNDISTYEQAYAAHARPELLGESVYGLPEIYRDSIKEARVVGNPGCYPTGAILGLYPILKMKLIKTEGIVIDSKSGATGAGRTPSAATLFPEIAEGFHPYKVGSHRHAPEIEENLTIVSGVEVNVTFTPHLVPMNRGILTTIYAETETKVSTEDALNIFREVYAGEPFVRIMPQGKIPDTAWVRGSNLIDIGAVAVKGSKRLVVVTAIDNLVKGAAGQAIQNMNLILGLKEEAGLTDAPLFP